MLHLMRRVGRNYGVLDDDDGVVEWVTVEELRDLVTRQGLQIAGVTKDMSKLVSQTVKLPASKCNFAQGKNVFTDAIGCVVGRQSGKFSIRVGQRRYKGVLIPQDIGWTMRFNNGVEVDISSVDYCFLAAGNVEISVKVLYNIGIGREPAADELFGD